MYASNFKAQLNHKKPSKAVELLTFPSPDRMRDTAHGAEEMQPNLYPVPNVQYGAKTRGRLYCRVS